MEVHRGNEVEDGDEKPGEQISTTIDASNEDASTAAEAHQLSVDYQEWGNEVQETGQEEPDQHNDDNTEYSTNTDLPPLVGRQRNEASSNDSTSDGSYDYHTDHDNNSIEGSDDESNNTVRDYKKETALIVAVTTIAFNVETTDQRNVATSVLLVIVITLTQHYLSLQVNFHFILIQVKSSVLDQVYMAMIILQVLVLLQNPDYR